MINLKLILVVLLMCCPVLAEAEYSLDDIRKAADQGNADAQYNLGIKYDKGEGVPLDKIKAYELYMKAARQGHEKAQRNLGMLCKESPWACK